MIKRICSAANPSFFVEKLGWPQADDHYGIRQVGVAALRWRRG